MAVKTIFNWNFQLLNEVVSDNDDDKDDDDDDDYDDDDDANNKGVEVVEIGTGETPTMLDR